jgi:hypothetical protein
MNTDGRSQKNGYECQQPIVGVDDIPGTWSAVYRSYGGECKEQYYTSSEIVDVVANPRRDDCN